MQKIIFRPICHLNFQEANSIYEEIRSNKSIQHLHQGSLIQRGFEPAPYSNSMVSNNNPQFGINPNEKNLTQNTRTNRLNSLPQNPQYGANNSNPTYSSPMAQHAHTLSPGQNKGSQKMISRDSIIHKYDDFFGQKVNVDILKQENSRLYYEKLALQASVQKLKGENVRKDTEISRLKQFIETNKTVHNQAPKPLLGFQSQVVNQPSAQVHFRSTFQQKRPF